MIIIGYAERSFLAYQATRGKKKEIREHVHGFQLICKQYKGETTPRDAVIDYTAFSVAVSPFSAGTSSSALPVCLRLAFITFRSAFSSFTNG